MGVGKAPVQEIHTLLLGRKRGERERAPSALAISQLPTLKIINVPHSCVAINSGILRKDITQSPPVFMPFFHPASTSLLAFQPPSLPPAVFMFPFPLTCAMMTMRPCICVSLLPLYLFEGRHMPSISVPPEASIEWMPRRPT